MQNHAKPLVVVLPDGEQASRQYVCMLKECECSNVKIRLIPLRPHRVFQQVCPACNLVETERGSNSSAEEWLASNLVAMASNQLAIT